MAIKNLLIGALLFSVISGAFASDTPKPLGIQLGDTKFETLWARFPGLKKSCFVNTDEPPGWLCVANGNQFGIPHQYDVILSENITNIYNLPTPKYKATTENSKRIGQLTISFRSLADRYEVETGHKAPPDIRLAVKVVGHPVKNAYLALNKKYGAPSKVIKFPGVDTNAYFWKVGGTIICLHSYKVVYYYVWLEWAQRKEKEENNKLKPKNNNDLLNFL